MKRSRRNTGQRLLPLDQPPSWSSLSEELRGQILELWSQILVAHVNPCLDQQTEDAVQTPQNHPELMLVARDCLPLGTQPEPGATTR